MNWLPPNGALHGIALDHLMRWNLAALFSLFLLAHALLVFAILRRKSGTAPRITPSRSLRSYLFLHVLPILAIIALYAWMAITSQRLWAIRHYEGHAPSALQVEVTGVQFQWYFRYPGSDGVFGATRPNLVNAPAGNPLGIDPQDPYGRDDFVSSVLVLPAGRPVDIRLRSQDVIHGFFIPGMRLKQDAIPGMLSHLHFTPTVPGDYPILCSQVCGLGHARMQARLRVLPPAAYAQWLTTREHTQIAIAGAPAAPGLRP